MKQKVDSFAGLVLFGDWWDDKWRRRQQIAHRLAKRQLFKGVLYVEYPLTLSSLAKFLMRKADPEATSRWRRVFRHGFLYKPEDSDVWVLTPLSLLSQFEESGANKIQTRWQYGQLRSAFRQLFHGTPPGQLAVIVATPYRSYSYYSNLGLKVMGYDCADDFTKAYDLSEKRRSELIRNDEELARHARVITCVAESLVQLQKPRNPNSYRIPNGVDWEMFSASREAWDLRKTCSLPEGVRLLGYAGDLSYRVDMELLDYLLERRPDWVFLAVGPSRGALPNRENARYLGEVPLARVPAFLRGVDVCLLPHRVDPFTNSMSPLKLFDYLAVGKPVVATRVAGAAELAEVVYLADSKEEFLAKMEQALREDSEEKRKRRLDVARSASWETRIDQFLEVFPIQPVYQGRLQGD